MRIFAVCLFWFLLAVVFFLIGVSLHGEEPREIVQVMQRFPPKEVCNEQMQFWRRAALYWREMIDSRLWPHMESQFAARRELASEQYHLWELIGGGHEMALPESAPETYASAKDQAARADVEQEKVYELFQRLGPTRFLSGDVIPLLTEWDMPKEAASLECTLTSLPPKVFRCEKVKGRKKCK